MQLYSTQKEFNGELNDPIDAVGFLRTLAEAVGFRPVAYNVQMFPTADNRGGTGVTATVYFTESYATIDTWPQSDQIHLTLVTCKPFKEETVDGVIKDWQES